MINKLKKKLFKPSEEERLKQSMNFRYRVRAKREETEFIQDKIVVSLEINNENQTISLIENIWNDYNYTGFKYIGRPEKSSLEDLAKMTKREWEELAMKKVKEYLTKKREQEQEENEISALLDKLNSQSGIFTMEVE